MHEGGKGQHEIGVRQCRGGKLAVGEIFRRFSPIQDVGAAWLLELVLNGCAAYRTQLFCYLKSCGREELSTSNLWQGVDAAVPA